MVGLRTLERSTMLILLLVLATVNSLFYPSVSPFQRADTGAFTPITVHLQPTSTTPYMATFRITKNPGTLSPWVLYPQNDKTVWVVARRRIPLRLTDHQLHPWSTAARRNRAKPDQRAPFVYSCRQQIRKGLVPH